MSGEPIRIAGSGFSPLQNVTLRVTHEDGAAEPHAGHEAFLVKTDALGKFQADWAISLHDANGRGFVLEAEDLSGTIDQTAFRRIARIEAVPPVDLSSGTVRIYASGLNARELVSIQASDGHGHRAQNASSDDSGTLTADVVLPQETPDATIFTVTLTSSRSGLVLSLPLTNYVISPHRPNGVPTLEAVRLHGSLAEIGHRTGSQHEDFFITWNTQSWPRGNASVAACALFDTNADERELIDFAVCAQVAAKDSIGQTVVLTPTSPQVFTCDNRQSDHCGSPAPYGNAAELRAFVETGSLQKMGRDSNLSEGGDTHRATLRLRIDKTFLPRNTTLARVCSYNDTFAVDCIAPGDNVTATFDDTVIVASTLPALTGKIAFHSYVRYNDGTSQLFVLDLSTGSLTNLSKSWTNLKDPMNAHWSPDGTKLVFMARPKKGGSYSAWFDIFLYTIGQRGAPVNLTKTATLHDEDPKFSPDGSRIVYKVRPSKLVEMDISGLIRNTIVSSAGPERSMPYYTSDASAVWFSHIPAGATGSAASIHRINVNGSNDVVIVDSPGMTDFYPIRDTVGEFLYSRTVSATNLYGQVYLFNGTQGVSLPFNTPDADYSDAFPLGTQYIIVSSTRAGGLGGYDLYIADRNTGTLWPLSSYNGGVNTSREELGAAYTSN